MNSSYGVNDSTGYIEKKTDVLGSDDELPSELLVIGYGDGGSRICLAIDGDERGQVWLTRPSAQAG